MSFFSLSKMLRWVLFLLLFFLAILCTLFALLQSKWAKEQIKHQITALLQQAGIESQLSELDGKLPFSWTMQEAHLHFNPSEELNLHHLTLRLGFFSLFRGKIDINYLQIESAVYQFSTPPSSSPCSIEDFKKLLREGLDRIHLPFSLNLSHLGIDSLLLWNHQTEERLSLGVTGKLKVSKDKNHFSTLLTLFDPDSHHTYLEASLHGDQALNHIETSLHLQLSSLPSFSPIQGELLSSIYVKGPWSTWKALLRDLPITEEPLTATAAGSCLQTHVAALPLLDPDWKFATSVKIGSSEEIDIQKLIFKSEGVQVKIKGTLQSQWHKSRLLANFSCADLSSYSSLFSEGSLTGKCRYEAGEFRLLFHTQKLQLDHFAVNTISGTVQGILDPSQITAQVELSSDNAQIPFKNHFSLLYSPDLLSVTSLVLSTEEDLLQGEITYHRNNHLYTGTLSLSIEDLNRFELFFPHHRLYGSLKTEISFLPQKGVQDLLCTLTGSHMRYENILIDDLSIRSTLHDLFTHPEGEVCVLAEKIYREGVYLERLQIDTHSTPTSSWPFLLAVEGRLETPFEGHLKGNWKKTDEQLHIELREAAGSLLNIPFLLEQPVSLSLQKRFGELTPLSLQIGSGSLHSSFQYQPEQVHAEIDIQHFPLELLRCFNPHFGLTGFFSAKGEAKGSADQLQGYLNTILEEASLFPLGNKEPFQSKGSIQMHFDHNRIQIHADLKAIDQQFLDLSASLPFHYTLYPFHLDLASEEPTSAELTAEGKLEDLFDFINLGTNHFTGLISCRLFLSQTLQNPSLLGSLEWQKGTYENYFTGITLKSIEAEFEAANQVIHLKKLSATDDLSGTVSATGSIELKPQEHFPYHFSAEMDHLHAVRFDMIDCQLSGPIYLTGTTQNMLAQGNLIIDRAHIQVTERLPYEISSLPFTYIHKPQHLDSIVTPSRSRFTFHLDLELTAQDKVFVEGKGLNAELEGDIHVHGTNTNVAANGQFNLVKGEYVFSGKVFKLTEASILFNDKPTPSAYLNVSGTLSLPDITITAMMRGPITSPQLTFQSNPHKPTSSILARILFNKDISEINHMEAVQLASTLISLSGGAAPDVLESIRKTIGVDRLNISSSPGSDQMAVQVGKYLTRGIMITLSQSATSSQVIVEVELPKGFIFQAETQEEEEGKFSLKWRKSY